MFQQPQSNADSAAMTSLVDIAAAIESRLYDAESRVQTLQRDLLQLQRRHDSARRWVAAIRWCHRSRSHAATTRVIRDALASLESSHPNAQPYVFDAQVGDAIKHVLGVPGQLSLPFGDEPS